MPLFEPTQFRPETSLARAVHTAAATHAAATITLPGIPGIAHAITGIAFSYAGSGTLTGGLVAISDGSTAVFSIDVPTAGIYVIPWTFHGTPGNSLTASIGDGGANVTGKINLLGYAAFESLEPGAGGEVDFSDYAESGLIPVIL